MAKSKQKQFRTQLMIATILGAFGFAALVFLSVAVVRDLKLLNSAMSDNVQWTLSQAEVEFLEFEIKLDASAREATPDLAPLRRAFDIFYSRIGTLSQASIYAPLREVPEFATNLAAMRVFLDDTVPIIDAQDSELIASLPDLSEKTTEIRNTVRRLSNSGLNFFAQDSDKRRTNVADTLVHMAIGVATLMAILLLFALYLGYLNKQNLRRRQQAIQISKRLNVVTSTALDAVIVSDINGIILDFNTAATKIFGYSAEEAIGRELGALIVPDHLKEAHDKGMQRMHKTGEKRVVGHGQVQLEAKCANGKTFPVEFAIQSANTDKGEIFIAFLRDISHRVAAERELVEARDRALAGEKAKTDFLATMSHEIRTPLNGLLGNLTLLRDTALDDKQNEYIKNMDTSGKLLMSHISDVLDITKYDAGKMQLRPDTMNVSTLLQDIVDNQSAAAEGHDTTLTWGWSGESCDWIFADKERLQHVLMNVIGNAVKFTRDGKVSVTASMRNRASDKPALQIIVKDTGIGMSTDLKAQVFDDFMTGDSAYDRDVSGTGLGLGIALRFVKAMGGAIEVESAPHKGSTFNIVFPVTISAPPAPQSAPEQTKSTAEGGSILLVEDNEINRFVAREMLSAKGYTVTEAQNGKIAVELASTQRFDLILMDIAMPVMDGRAATRAIRALDTPSAKTPIIALTANAMPEEQEAFLSDGMNDILTKPLSRETMYNVLSHYIGKDRAAPL